MWWVNLIQILFRIRYNQLKWKKKTFKKVDISLSSHWTRNTWLFWFSFISVNPLVSYILTIVHWAECCRVFKVFFFSSRFNFRIQYSTEWVHICSGTGCRNPCFYTWTGHVSISGRWRIYYFSRIRLFCCIETGEQCFI